jgi:predicted 3-demethylubiquinone-9 3-methyltransferase (glyoxalase superfamily)
MASIQRIVPCLWFDDEAEAAVQFYLTVFERSRITRITHYGKAGKEVHHHDPGSVLTIAFELLDQPFTALNGGPEFKFTEALSLQVMCDNQEEIDRYWARLSVGGDANAQQCGWLKDRFGLSWQIVPSALPELLSDEDSLKADRTMKALLQMKKLDLGKLRQAHGH